MQCSSVLANFMAIYLHFLFLFCKMANHKKKCIIEGEILRETLFSPSPFQCLSFPIRDGVKLSLRHSLSAVASTEGGLTGQQDSSCSHFKNKLVTMQAAGKIKCGYSPPNRMRPDHNTVLSLQLPQPQPKPCFHDCDLPVLAY